MGKRPLLKSLIVAVVLLAGLQVWQWYKPSKSIIAWRVQPIPYFAEDYNPAVQLPKAYTPPVQIETLDLSEEKSRKKFEKKVGIPAPTYPVITVKEIDKLPQGGKVVLGLKYIKIEDGTEYATVIAEVVPNKIKFLEWDPYREFEVALGLTPYGLGLQAELSQHLGRTGPVDWKLKGGVLFVIDPSIYTQSKDAIPYAMVSASTRF